MHRRIESGPQQIFVEALNAPGSLTENLKAAFPTYEFGVIKGVKYLKIFKKHPGSEHGSVVGFINRKTGEIHNADSWTKVGRKIGVIANWS